MLLKFGIIFDLNLFEDQPINVPPRLIGLKEMEKELLMMLEEIVVILPANEEAVVHSLCPPCQ